MQPKHSAIVAGLTLALSIGAAAAPAYTVAEETTPGVASDATDIDKGLYTQQSFSGVLRSVQGVSFVNVSNEMKYFTKYESHGKYNQGFSYGDGYNALGYYQFDRRYSLISFMKQVYNYDSAKYSMLKPAIDRAGDISNANNPMYANGQLTELGRIAQQAFLDAYNTDPAEFSALQDAYAYNSYYAVTEAWLKNALGIDISGRADCVKGMVWSITNMCGTLGCQDFFTWANLSNGMSDREFVTALSNSVVNNVAKKYSNQPKYHEGWKNRYKNELKDCLVYIAEDEAAAATPTKPAPTEPAPEPSPAPVAPVAPKPDADGADDSDKTDAPSTDTGGDSANSGANAPGGSAAGDSSSSDNTGAANGSAGTGTTPGPADSSTDSSAGSGSDTSDNGSSEGSGTDVSEDSSNKIPDSDGSSTDNKPSANEQLGSMLGSSLTAGITNGASSKNGSADQGSAGKADDVASDSTDVDAGKPDEPHAKKDVDKGDAATTAATSSTTAKTATGNMPKTGDLIVMASLASASLATLGATSIVSGKHKLDRQNKAAGEDASEE